MNLLQLKNRVIQKLKERETPQYWTEDEIIGNINAGCFQLAKDTKARESLQILRASDLSNGYFLFPNNIISFSGVFWEGQKLEQTSSNFLDGYYKNGHNDFSIGDKENSGQDWRGLTADSPNKWLLDDGMVKLYPIPSVFTSSGLRTKSSCTVSAGTKIATISSGDLTFDKDYIDLYLNGVYQNKTEWTILSSSTIELAENVFLDSIVEVVYTPNTTIGVKSKKYVVNAVTGTKYITIPRVYEVGSNALTISINGIVQSSSAFTETTNTKIKLITALEEDSEIGITVLERYYAGQVAIKCCVLPSPMAHDEDEPDLPNTLMAYHDAIWCWALMECYSRESQEKDMNLSQFYLKRYYGIVKTYNSLYSDPLEVTPRDSWVV
jgi:hypothetical protein